MRVTDLKSCCFILSVPLLLFLLVSIHGSQCPGTELGIGGGVVVGGGMDAGPWDLLQREEAHWLGSGIFPEHLTNPKDALSTLILVSFKP